ncbi:MAG: sigma-70 family RNA polymerase sigma factor [Gemmataceae bacterium]
MNRLIQHLFATCGRDEVTDGELLTRFLSGRDATAFAELVRRHGPMVWGVCSRLLRNQDAEDAFQATFLVLVQKATTLPDRETVGNWLYGVAYQTAVRMRALAARRSMRERQATVMPEPSTPERYVWNDLVPVLDEELSRLPDKYRALIVLCDLEDKTRKEVARQLSIPEGTVASRLATARTMLAKRLSRRGVVGSSVLLGTVLSTHAALACVPMSVISSTISAATLVAAGQVAAGAMSPTVATLTKVVTKAMFMSKMKNLVTVVLVTALCVGGASVGLLKWPVAVAQQPGMVKPPQQLTKAPAPVPKNTRKPPITPYAHFLFDGTARNEGTGTAELRLRNTKFTDNALELNGIYDEPGNRKDAYKAICETPRMNYEKFSIALRFKADEFGEGKSHLFSGGAGTGRWFGLSRSARGNLAVMTNTGEFQKEIDGARLEEGKWTVVACSVDVARQQVILALNGKKVAVLDFAKDAPLKIDLGDGRANFWTFTDYSTPDVFHGFVDELRLYDRALSEQELEEIPLRPASDSASNKDKVVAVVPKGEVATLERKLVGAWIGQGACVGNAVYHADGTYHNYGYGPGAGHYEIGTWKIDWSELPPTLVLRPMPTERGIESEETKYLLLRLTDRRFDYRWKDHDESRIEEHRRGTDMDDAVIRIKILDRAVQRYLGNEKHGAGVKLPRDLKTLVDTKIIPSAKLLLDPWGGEIRYDLSGKNNKGKKPDIWAETKDKKIIGNWNVEK